MRTTKANKAKYEAYINGFVPPSGRINAHRFDGEGFEYHVVFPDGSLNKWSVLDKESNKEIIRDYWDFCKYVEEQEIPKVSENIKIFGTGNVVTKNDDIEVDPYYYGVSDDDFMFILSKNILVNHYQDELIEYFENGLEY